jgi:hypothetical protein
MSRSNQNNTRREPVTDKNFVMPFGKYRGWSIEMLLESNAAYLVWLHNNTDFELCDDLLEEAETAPIQT